MNRTSFLKAQPFLFPLESITWPPPLPAESFERSNCRRETLLQNFFLSIEPVLYTADTGDRLSQHSLIRSRGPAFFRQPNEDNKEDSSGSNHKNYSFDPAMCPVELSVQSAAVTLPPRASCGEASSVSNHFTSPKSHQKLMRRQQQQQQQESGETQNLSKQVRESTAFLKIESNVYQMDLAQVENIQLEESEGDTGNTPSSLLIQFGSICILRIFSLTGVDADILSTLKGVQTVLLQLLIAEDQIAAEFPSHFYMNPLASPAGSSTTGFSSSQEPGQQDFSRLPVQTAETPTGSSDDPLPKASSAKSVWDNNECKVGFISNGNATREGQDKETTIGPTAASPVAPNVFSILRKRQAAYLQSKSDLDYLEKILMRPAATRSKPTDDEHAKRLRRLENEVTQLIISIPEHLAASYCIPTQQQEVIRQQTERIHTYEMELDGLVQSFWPAPSRIGTTNGLSRQPSMDRRLHARASECIEKANLLLQKHKEVTSENLALTLLPTRGL